MKLFAISDPHLSLGVPGKSMDRFGAHWHNHTQKMEDHWRKQITSEDIIVLPGDISWANTMEQVQSDLEWLHSLPGTKILLKGNHDHWWPKNKTQKESIPPSIHMVQNNSIAIGNYVFFGSRLWDTTEYSVMNIIDWNGDLPSPPNSEETEKIEKLYDRELERLQLSINTLSTHESTPNQIRIGLCHYPPLDPSLQDSRASKLFQSAGAQHVIFGHLHSLKKGMHFGTKENTEYHLTSCDYIDFIPKYICG